MKKTKKLLALALVLVFALGMIPMTASAAVITADYSDADAITNTEAVEVLTTLRVIEGTNGAYRPADNVTRAEAAAILARLVAGRAAADSLPAAATGFVDVPASHWASKYIAYCVAQGYVAGYGNRRFGPNDNVTSAQFAVMLLRAVGYGKLGEFEGSLWETNAIVLGMREKILEGDKNFSAPASRDETAQYAFKALTDVHMVDLSADRTNYIPQVRRAPDPYNIGQFIDAPVAIMDNVYPQLEAQRSTPGYYTYSGGVTTWHTGDTVADVFGRPSTRWVYAGVEIGLYPFKAIASFSANLGPTTEARRNAVLSAVGSGYAFSDDIMVYLNGNENADTMASRTLSEDKGTAPTFDYSVYKDIKSGNRNNIAETIGALAENGLLVELFISYPDTAYARIDVVTVTQTDLYQVTAINTTARQVTLQASSPLPIRWSKGNPVVIRASDNEDLYNAVKDCAVDDYVLLTMGWDAQYVPADLYVPENVTGVIRTNAIVAGRVANVTFAGTGTRYNLAYRNGAMADLGFVNAGSDTGIAYPPANGTDESILFLDQFGYVAAMKAAAPPRTEYVYVLQSDLYITASNGVSYPGFRGVLANGEEVFARMTNNPTSVNNDLYTYKINGGVYTLDNPSPGTYTGLTPAGATSTMAIDLDGGLVESTQLRLVDTAQNGFNYNNLYARDVKFIYVEFTPPPVKFTVREGVQKIGTAMVSGSYAVIEKRGPEFVVTAVFIKNQAPVSADPSSIMFIHGPGERGTIGGIDGKQYTSYRAFLPGEVESVDIFVDTTYSSPSTGFYTWTKTEIDNEPIYLLFSHTSAGNTSYRLTATATSMLSSGTGTFTLVTTTGDYTINSNTKIADTRPPQPQLDLPIGNNSPEALASIANSTVTWVQVVVMYDAVASGSVASRVFIMDTGNK